MHYDQSRSISKQIFLQSVVFRCLLLLGDMGLLSGKFWYNPTVSFAWQNVFSFLLMWLGFTFCESIWKSVNRVVTKKTIWSSLTDLKKNERFSSLNKLWCSIGEKVNTKIWYQMLINRGYYMPVRWYEFYLRMVNSISHYRVEPKRVCNFLFII